MRFWAPLVVGLMALIAYRTGRVYRNNIFTLAPLPGAYFSRGNYSTQCNVVKAEGMQYCEDAVFWDLRDDKHKLVERRVVLTCDPGRKQWNTVMGPLINPEPHGAVWMYTPSSPTTPIRLTLEGYPPGHDFHPLGLELWPSYNGNASNVFIINHARQRSFIEQFQLHPKSTALKWVRTLDSQYFVAPNSLALTSPTSFYVSNDHLLTRRLPIVGHVLPLVETLLAVPVSWVAHVSVEEDGGGLKHEFAALGITFANGVAMSHDGKRVAVASSTWAGVHFYDRNETDNSLDYTATVDLPFCPDNVNFDDAGALIAAGHVHFISLTKVAAGIPGTTSPSWITSITPSSSSGQTYDLDAPYPASAVIPGPIKDYDVRTLYQSDGKGGFGMSTTGLRDKGGDLYSVGLYEEGLLVCRG